MHLKDDEMHFHYLSADQFDDLLHQIKPFVKHARTQYACVLDGVLRSHDTREPITSKEDMQHFKK